MYVQLLKSLNKRKESLLKQRVMTAGHGRRARLQVVIDEIEEMIAELQAKGE